MFQQGVCAIDVYYAHRYFIINKFRGLYHYNFYKSVETLYHISISIFEPVFTAPVAVEPKIWKKGMLGKLSFLTEAISGILIG